MNHAGESKIYLRVPFVQKDIAKKLGARFDFQKKSWYVEKDQDLTPFSAWLYPQQQLDLEQSNLARSFDDVLSFSSSAEPRISQDVSGAEIEQTPPSIPLSSLMQMVGQTIQNHFRQPMWVNAEIAQIKMYRQHHYLDLVQRSEGEGEELAKVRAIIWSTRENIVKQFEEQTGKTLAADLKVLLQVNCVFHERYGFSLDIVRINAEYTLGEMQRKINAIRKKLQVKGIYAQNREKLLPEILTRICVISPQNAAGLADFRYYLDPLVENQLCCCDYYSAVFQGDQANKSINACLQKINDKMNAEDIQESYQLIIMIRGGGGISDLQFLEEYEINEAICQSTVPIWVGLGHQTDKLLINEVANRHFPTPTAVAKQIVQHILRPLKNAVAQWNDIKLLCTQRVAEEKMQIEQQYLQLHQSSHKVSQKAHQQLNAEQTAIRIYTKQKIKMIKDNVSDSYQQIQPLTQNILHNRKQTLRVHKEAAQKESILYLQNHQRNLQIMHSIIKNSHPQKILKRGFAIIRDEDHKPLKNIQQLHMKNKVKIEMIEGHVDAEIKPSLES